MPLNSRQREILDRVRSAGGIDSADFDGPDLRIANGLVVKLLLVRAYRNRYRFEISRRSEAALADMGRVPKAGRVYCLNPKCGCTGDAAKSDELVCGKCWKLIPRDLTAAYRDLHALKRKLDRRRRKRAGEIVAVPLAAIGIDRRIAANWSAIRAFWLAPAKPEGLDTFLDEMGWNPPPETERSMA